MKILILKLTLPASIFFLSFFGINYAFSQNVGVNNNNPTEKLDVGGSVKFSGALLPSGSLGTSGYALTSQGPGLAPIWASATANQQFYYASGTNFIKIDYTANDTLIPGLTKTITVPSTGSYDAWIYTDGGARWEGAENTNAKKDSNRANFAQVSIWVDGIRARNYVIQLNSPGLPGISGVSDPLYPWAICWRQSLAAGTHTILVKGKVYRTSNYYKNATYSKRTKIKFGEKDPSSGLYYYDWSWLIIGLIKK